jgi:hypothetical protein
MVALPSQGQVVQECRPMRTRLAGLATAIALACAFAGCMFDAPPHPRVEDACVVGGCSGELCADQPLVSPCIWHDAYVCYRDATCARQADGACGWTPTTELNACLASHASGK